MFWGHWRPGRVEVLSVIAAVCYNFSSHQHDVFMKQTQLVFKSPIAVWVMWSIDPPWACLHARMDKFANTVRTLCFRYVFKKVWFEEEKNTLDESGDLEIGPKCPVLNSPEYHLRWVIRPCVHISVSVCLEGRCSMTLLCLPHWEPLYEQYNTSMDKCLCSDMLDCSFAT